MNQIIIGNYITKKRKEKNLTQMQLAEKLGVTNKTISKWENGKDVDKDCIGSNDSAQIVDLLKRTQELEQHTHILYAILLIFMGIVMWRQIMIKVEEN